MHTFLMIAGIWTVVSLVTGIAFGKFVALQNRTPVASEVRQPGRFQGLSILSA